MRHSTLTAPAGALAVAIACATNPATGKKQLMLVSEAQEMVHNALRSSEPIRR